MYVQSNNFQYEQTTTEEKSVMNESIRKTILYYSTRNIERISGSFAFTSARERKTAGESSGRPQHELCSRGT